MATYNICDFGAIGDGETSDTSAIQQAIDTCYAGGGGQVLVPAGKRFRSGTIVLKSNVELHVERGAAILASGDPGDYPHRLHVTALENGRPDPQQPGLGMLITAERAEHVAITGGGVIDGGGQQFVAEDRRYIYRMQPWRPFTVFLLGCTDVTVRDITLRDGALWTLRLSGCDDVLIDGIRIHNDLKLPNSDGIDLDRCRNVRVVGCHIQAGDDCICLKTCHETAAWGDTCENIVVTGCTLISTSSALIIGAEARAPIRNVIFEGCVIRGSHRGLAIHLSEEADVENVIFANMIVETRLFDDAWWGRGEPIYIVALPWTEQHSVGRIRHVRCSNVLCRSENGVLIYGWAAGQIEDLVLENIRVELDRWTSWPGGRQDLRPTPGEGLPVLPTNGFFVKNATGVTLRNCEVVWGARRPDYFRHALATEGVEGLTVEHLRGESAHPDRFPAIAHT